MMSAEQGATAHEALELGWHTYCLMIKDISASLDFYQRLGFTVAGGQLEHKWLALNNAQTDLTIMQQGMPENCLNFRGADIHALAQQHRSRGFELIGFADYDPAINPAQWHSDPEGNALPLDGSASYTIKDPDDNVLYFDTVPLERSRQAAGQPYCWPGHDGKLQPGQRELGWLHLCLNVADIESSVEFYQRLGLRLLEDHRAGNWAILGYDQPGYFRLALFKGHIQQNLMNFRGADIFALAEQLTNAGFSLHKAAQTEPDGSASFELIDPDDNVLYFNTFPGEQP